MKIVITGPKGTGKTAVGTALSKLISWPVVDTDRMIEDLHTYQDDHRASCRELFTEHGETFFRKLEREASQQAGALDWHLVLTGGSLMLDSVNRKMLRENALLVFLKAKPEIIWERIQKHGIPPWYAGPSGYHQMQARVAMKEEVLVPFADMVIDTTEGSPEDVAQKIFNQLPEVLAWHSQSANTYGEIIRVTTFGESHGPAIGAVLDGVRPGIELSEEEIQVQMNRRRPGQSQVTTPRSEKDKVHILSGVFEGKTTGAPIAMVVYNEDQDPSKYEGLRNLFRPGHADFTFYQKYGIRDHRGGGRSSGRETAGRVMCGAIALKLLSQRGVQIVAHAVEIAGIAADTCDHSVIETNPVRCADPNSAQEMEAAIVAAKEAQDSVGGIVQLEIIGLPAGLGDPVFYKLDARLTNAIMTLGAVKGVEIGDGFAITRLKGSTANDWMKDGEFATNHAGGITGGISTGQPIKMRIAVKPTSSIATPQLTIDLQGQNQTIEVHGRHDPCIVPRVIPVIETMAALVVLDAWEIQSRLRPGTLPT